MTGLKTAEIKVTFLSGLDKLITREQSKLRWELAEDRREAGIHTGLSRKAGCVPLTVYEDRRRDARQHDAPTCARSETRAAWRVAHNACGGGS